MPAGDPSDGLLPGSAPATTAESRDADDHRDRKHHEEQHHDDVGGTQIRHGVSA